MNLRLPRLLAVLALLVCSPALAGQPSMSAAAWQFLYSPGMPAHPVQNGAGWYFGFPVYNGALPCKNDQACAGVHYLVTGSGILTGARSILVVGRIVVTGHPQFHWETEPQNHGKGPATFRLFIQRQGDNLHSDYFRWWSNPASVVIQAGAFRMRVLLKPGQWSSVFGHRGDSSAAARAGFAAALAHPVKIGMTFGGGDSFGHGVNVRGGTARMVVTRFTVER